MKRRSRKKRRSKLVQRILAIPGAFVGNWLVRRTAIVLVCFILAVNLAVTALGASGAHLLSPFHIWNKARAIGLFASHLVQKARQPETVASKQALRRAVRRHNVPSKLVFAIAKAESDFVPWRVSHTGAMGLMQLMPDTAAELGVVDPFHPQQNADGGVKYLARLYKKYGGDIRRVAAAYNWGPGRVPRTGPYRPPAETRRYVRKVVAMVNLGTIH